MPRDLHNHIHPVRGVSPVATAGDNTAIVSQIIDRQGFNALEFLIACGAIPDADATYTCLVEHDDVIGFGTAVAVPDEELLGLESQASFIFSDDNKIFKIGYVGYKQFVRVTLTPANNTGATLICIIAVLAEPKFLPTANPPA